jgi:hypothetical protein
MAPVALTVAFTGRGFAICLAAAFLALWCVAFGVSASLGFLATAKDESISGRAAVADADADRKARFELAKTELAALKGQTPTVMRRRRELETILRETSATPARKTVGHVDPQAHVIAGYLQAFGLQVTADKVSLWTTAFGTMFYEVAATVALVVARAAGEAPRPVPVRPAPETPAPAEGLVRPAEAARCETGNIETGSKDDHDDTPPPPRAPGKRGRPANATPADVVRELRKRGGKVAGSLNGLGKALGTKSKSATHRMLHRCAELGLVSLDTGPHGIAVALAA